MFHNMYEVVLTSSEWGVKTERIVDVRGEWTRAHDERSLDMVMRRLEDVVIAARTSYPM